MLKILLGILSAFYVSVHAQIPATLLPTIGNELNMIYGREDHPVTDDIWMVQHKFYRMTSLTMFIRSAGNLATAFEVTFSPDPILTSGWPDQIHMFGSTYGFPGTTITFSNEITHLAICVDDMWASY